MSYLQKKARLSAISHGREALTKGVSGHSTPASRARLTSEPSGFHSLGSLAATGRFSWLAEILFLADSSHLADISERWLFAGWPIFGQPAGLSQVEVVQLKVEN